MPAPHIYSQRTCRSFETFSSEIIFIDIRLSYWKVATYHKIPGILPLDCDVISSAFLLPKSPSRILLQHWIWTSPDLEINQRQFLIQFSFIISYPKRKTSFIGRKEWKGVHTGVHRCHHRRRDKQTWHISYINTLVNLNRHTESQIIAYLSKPVSSCTTDSYKSSICSDACFFEGL